MPLTPAYTVCHTMQHHSVGLHVTMLQNDRLSTFPSVRHLITNWRSLKSTEQGSYKSHYLKDHNKIILWKQHTGLIVDMTMKAMEM